MDQDPADNEMPPVRSIALRVQRTTVEYSYIQIPLTEDLFDFDTDGVGRLNASRAFAHGLELSQEPEVAWFAESQKAEPHPLQKAPEPEERAVIRDSLPSNII